MLILLKRFYQYCLLLIGLSLLLSHEASAELSIRFAETNLENKVYQLDATLNYELTETTIEALQNGVILTFVLTIDVEKERWYMWDSSVANLKQRYQLKYYALSEQYAIKNVNTGIQEIFPTLDAALTKMGNLTDFPLLDAHLIDTEGVYLVYLYAYLDIEALPAPLRPVAYFSSDWHLSSNKYVCLLQSTKSMTS